MVNTEIKEAEYYNWFDDITGIENSDTALTESCICRESIAPKERKPSFFLNPTLSWDQLFLTANLIFDLNLKYDVFDDDELLVAGQTHRQLGGSTL